MNKLTLAITVLALCGLSLAQIPGDAAAAQQTGALHANSAASACAFTFTSGAGDTFLKYCVTSNGNIAQLETPEGHEHLAVLDVFEGYGVCDATAGSKVAYFDYADSGDTGNWDPAAVITSNAKSIKISRTTSDGIWSLTQTISQAAGPSPSVKIAMALKNNTAVDRLAVLLRSADVDADGLPINNLDATHNSAFAWNSITHPFGLKLQNVGKSPAERQRGLVRTVPQGPDPCSLQTTPGPLTVTDGSVQLAYVVRIRKNSSKTVVLEYRGL